MSSRQPMIPMFQDSHNTFRLLLTGYSVFNSAIVRCLQVNRIFREIDPDARILEIGGGYNPRFKKSNYPNARHLDHCSKDELIAKYSKDSNVSHLISNIQEIDYVWSGQPIECLIS